MPRNCFTFRMHHTHTTDINYYRKIGFNNFKVNVFISINIQKFIHSLWSTIAFTITINCCTFLLIMNWMAIDLQFWLLFINSCIFNLEGSKRVLLMTLVSSLDSRSCPIGLVHRRQSYMCPVQPLIYNFSTGLS